MLRRLLLPAALALLLSGCPAPPKQAAAPPVDKTPLSQPVSINLNFLGVAGRPDPTAEFKSKIDPDELRLFPIRFPVSNMLRNTKIDPKKDSLNFLFGAVWGKYKTEAKPLTLVPGKSGFVEFTLADSTLRIEPKLLKPDHGIYLLTLTLETGEQVGQFTVEGWGDYVPVKGGSKVFPAKKVYNDKLRRITGYEVKNGNDPTHQKQGLIFMGEGYTTDNKYLLPIWADYPRIFPEVDVQVYSEHWFSLRDIVRSCHTIKAEPDGYPLDYGNYGGRYSGGGVIYSGPRCYG